MRLFNRYFSRADVLLLLGDVALAIFAIWAVHTVRHVTGLAPTNWSQWAVQGEGIAALVVVSFYYSDLYVIDQTIPRSELVLRLANGFGIACLAIGGVGLVIPGLGFQKLYLIEMLLVGIGLFSWRIGFVRMLEKVKVHSKILVVGTNKIATLVAEELCRRKHLGMQVVGFIGSQDGQMTLSYGNPVHVSLPVSPPQSIFRVIEREGVNRILVEGEGSCSGFPAQELITLRLRGIPVEDCHSFYERLTSKIPISDLQPGWIVLSEGFKRGRWISLTKRVTDLLVSTLGLILTSPIILVTAIAIKLDTRGPVLYSQERVGLGERPFTIYKFRSMVHRAEAQSGPVWAEANDSRVTRVGKIIRKLRIDELPQMINVLKGEMSVVGPRPERPFFVSKLKEQVPYYHLRFCVKPGITGWAQILYVYGDNVDSQIEKLQYELYYVKNISALLDLQIIFETVKVVLLGRGAQ